WRQKRDPIMRFRRFLESRGIWSDDEEEALQESVKERVAAVIQKAESFTPPDPARMFDFMYAELPDHLREQRESLLRELAERGEAR
ncbi:MAG TPA: thiamine pyrophosphate-dependent enzyme, partial [Bacillota bacterium]